MEGEQRFYHFTASVTDVAMFRVDVREAEVAAHQEQGPRRPQVRDRADPPRLPGEGLRVRRDCGCSYVHRSGSVLASLGRLVAIVVVTVSRIRWACTCHESCRSGTEEYMSKLYQPRGPYPST